MIIGIGTDLCACRRIEKTLNRFPQKFTARVFLRSECEKAESRPNPAAQFAKFFAAKEACSKALGTGIRQGVYWKNFEIKNLVTGKPYIVLSGGASQKLKSLTPPDMKSVIDLSLSDEYPIANAVVIISALRLKDT